MHLWWLIPLGIMVVVLIWLRVRETQRLFNTMGRLARGEEESDD